VQLYVVKLIVINLTLNCQSW